MCEKSTELDDKIGHYELVSSMITDKKALRVLKQFINRYEAEKAALHPEPSR